MHGTDQHRALGAEIVGQKDRIAPPRSDTPNLPGKLLGDSIPQEGELAGVEVEIGHQVLRTAQAAKPLEHGQVGCGHQVPIRVGVPSG